MVLDAALLNTQYYMVEIKGKVKQSREWSSALPLHLSVVAIKKRALGHPRLRSPTLLTYFYIYIYIYSVCMCVYIYIYMYEYSVCVCMYVYMCIYI